MVLNLSENSISFKIYKTGVIHGRFQILHSDHMKYIMAGKRLCRHIVIGITNPDPLLTREEDADPKRSSIISNPLTYYERYILIKTAMSDYGIRHSEYSIVPLPINLPENYKYYVPMNAVFFLTIYDNWGRQKLEYFRSLGLKTHVLWDVPEEQKGISGEDVRKRIIYGGPWEHMVPPAVAYLLKKWNISKRLKELQEV